MSDHDHAHEEDHTVCVKVGVFLAIVVGVIFFLGYIN